MTKVILQGPGLTHDHARLLARQLGGRVEPDNEFCLIRGNLSVDRLGELTQIRQQYPFDINVLSEDFDAASMRLLVTDMDSTLVAIESIDEVARYAGVREQVSRVTEAAMSGEISFAQSFTERLGLLAGIPTTALDEVYEKRLRLNPGALRMIETVRSRAIKVALVSGGFNYFAARLAKDLSLDYYLANEPETANHHLTGRVLGNIVGAETKAAFLGRLCQELNISTCQSIAVGDGANDLKMLATSGLGIAYHARPVVQNQADAVINYCGLEGVLGLLGFHANQARRVRRTP